MEDHGANEVREWNKQGRRTVRARKEQFIGTVLAWNKQSESIVRALKSKMRAE